MVGAKASMRAGANARTRMRTIRICGLLNGAALFLARHYFGMT